MQVPPNTNTTERACKAIAPRHYSIQQRRCSILANVEVLFHILVVGLSVNTLLPSNIIRLESGP